MGIERFEQLDVWSEAHALVLCTYKALLNIPDDEKYALIPQMRRSAVSVPANIAEGFKRIGQKDKVHFYNIAQGSLEELRYYYILSLDLNYRLDYTTLEAKMDIVSKMLAG